MLLWVHIHTGQAWKICPATAGFEPTTFGILAQCSSYWATRSGRFECAIFRNLFQAYFRHIFRYFRHIFIFDKRYFRHIFQACPVWICTQSNITQISYSPEYITPTQQISGRKIITTCISLSFSFNISLFSWLTLEYCCSCRSRSLNVVMPSSCYERKKGEYLSQWRVAIHKGGGGGGGGGVGGSDLSRAPGLFYCFCGERGPKREFCPGAPQKVKAALFIRLKITAKEILTVGLRSKWPVNLILALSKSVLDRSLIRIYEQWNKS